MTLGERDCGMQTELRETVPRVVPWNWLELEAPPKLAKEIAPG